MNKILLIFQREFITRVRKKSFLLTTILLPIFIFAVYVAIFYFIIYDGSKTQIAVVDNTNIFKDTIAANKDAEFLFINGLSQAQLAKQLQQGKYDGFLITNDTSASASEPLQLITAKSVGMITKESIQSAINNRLRELRINNMSEIQREALEIEKANREVKFSTLSGVEQSDVKTGISYALGMISGYLIFFILIIYGSIVMRGVMEEKINRIAEVVVSSVKPFQLMMGKILGIGAVGLLQFAIWIMLAGMLQAVATPFMMEGDIMNSMPGAKAVSEMSAIENVLLQLKEVNFALLIVVFAVYFLGGYLLYASLYAIVGCAVSDSEEDAQKLTFPVTIPLILSFILLTKAVNSPNSSIAIFGSIFPLTSPIVMMGRVAQGIPEGVSVWQLLLSIAVLIITFILSTMLAARIYRVGILMYGKKPTWKEIIKWAFRKS